MTDLQNHLTATSLPTAVALAYDPSGRLQTSTARGATSTFLYASDMLVGEYTTAGAIIGRYIPGRTDETLLWYQGGGTATPSWLHADNQGSIIAWSNAAGASGATYPYDPYGQPGTRGGWGGPRYRYAGAIAIPEGHFYHAGARDYAPDFGRFLQTDPAGFASDLNLYAYAGNDPINRWDPSGLADIGSDTCPLSSCTVYEIPIPHWGSSLDYSTANGDTVATFVGELLYYTYTSSVASFGDLGLRAAGPGGGGGGGGGGGAGGLQNVGGPPMGIASRSTKACHSSSAESGLAKALGFGSNAQDAMTSAGKLAAPEFAEDIGSALGPVGFGLAVAGETAQVFNDVGHGVRVDVSLLGAETRLISPLAGETVGAALGAPEGGIGALPGGIIGLVAGTAVAPTLGRLAQSDYLMALGCR